MSPLSRHPHVADSLGHSRRVLWEALPMRGWPVCSACRHCRKRALCRHGAHSSVLKGGRKCVSGPGRAIEYRLSFTCHIFCFRKTKRCIREALVRICTPQSTFHMASRTGPSGTTFQVKSTFSLSIISKLMHVQLKEFNLVITNSALVSPDCRNLSFFRSLFNNVPRLNHSGGKEFIV